jgi:uncharacterized protein YndB with AHSA1/START domain
MTDDSAPGAELVYTRTYNAPRELVFRCLVEPEHLTHFWGPRGMSAPLEFITIDPRAGGVFATLMVSDTDGSKYSLNAVFEEVQAPEKLVWTDLETGVLTTTTLTDLGDSRTEVEIRQSNVPDFFRSPEAQSGFRTSLDRFDEYLATLANGPRERS